MYYGCKPPIEKTQSKRKESGMAMADKDSILIDTVAWTNVFAHIFGIWDDMEEYQKDKMRYRMTW